MEVAVMHILAFILIFIVGSIIAACDGDGPMSRFSTS